MNKSKSLQALCEDERYRKVADVLQHADRISKAILTKPKNQSPKRELSPFAVQVKKIAPKYLAGQYQHKKIAREILNLQGNNNPTSEELKKIIKKVAVALGTLARRKEIPKTKPTDRLTKAGKTAESEDIEKNMGLIFNVLTKNPRFKARTILPQDWNRYITREEAIAAGRYGLMRALELHEPSRGTIGNFATIHILNTIAQAVKEKRRETYNTVSLNKINRTGTSLNDQLETPAPSEELFDNKLTQLLRHPKIENHHLIIWALHNIFDHSKTEIANHFKVHKNSIRYLLQHVDQFLEAEE